jgi:hypothetical protein
MPLGDLGAGSPATRRAGEFRRMAWGRPRPALFAANQGKGWDVPGSETENAKGRCKAALMRERKLEPILFRRAPSVASWRRNVPRAASGLPGACHSRHQAGQFKALAEERVLDAQSPHSPTPFPNCRR